MVAFQQVALGGNNGIVMSQTGTDLHGGLGLFKKNCLICALDFIHRPYDRSRVMVLGVCFVSQ